MKTIFMGTPDFSVPSLLTLLEMGHEILSVVTQPDRPRGRGHRVKPSPVKETAIKRGLPVLQPEKVREPGFIETVEKLTPEVIVVVAFGQIIPRRLLEIPPYGCINVHASLLPKYRGASPIHAALAAGESVTGVTTMYMDEGLDTGDIILKRSLLILPSDNAGTLHDKLAVLGAELLGETLHLIKEGKAPRTPQDHEQATYAPKLEKSMGEIDWTRPAGEILNQVRAVTPWPGAFTNYQGKTLKVLEVGVPTPEGAEPAAAGETFPPESFSAPGTVISVDGEYPLIRTGAGTVDLRRVQLPGKNPISGRDIANGLHLKVGDRFYIDKG